MKKLLALMLCLIIVFISTTCFAEILSKSPFEGMDGYKYDKFNKTWDYQKVWYHEYRDGVFGLGIEVYGGKDEQEAPRLFCFLRTPDNRSALYTITKLAFMIDDDTIYQFDSPLVQIPALLSPPYSYELLGDQSKNFLKDFANAKTITVRFISSNTYFDEELKNTSTLVKSLQTVARNILNANIWRYINEENMKRANSNPPVKQ